MSMNTNCRDSHYRSPYCCFRDVAAISKDIKTRLPMDGNLLSQFFAGKGADSSSQSADSQLQNHSRSSRLGPEIFRLHRYSRFMEPEFGQHSQSCQETIDAYPPTSCCQTLAFHLNGVPPVEYWLHRIVPVWINVSHH